MTADEQQGNRDAMEFDEARRHWGIGSVEVLFGMHDRVVTPWPTLPSLKGGPRIPSADHVFRSAPALTRIDPRVLWCTQPWILRHHVQYYLTGEWERTGRTSADQDKIPNRYPLVVADDRGRLAILTGHHRSAVALLEGRDVLVRMVHNEGLPLAVLPNLGIMGPSEGNATVDAESAVELVQRGAMAIVGSAAIAVEVMKRLGLTEDEILDRLSVADL